MSKSSSLFRQITCLLVVGVCLSVFGQNKPITLETAFIKGPRLDQSARHNGWLDDQHFLWYENKDDTRTWYKVNAKTGEREVFQRPDTSGKSYRVENKNRDAEAWISDGDLFFQRNDDQKPRQLTRSKGSERNPRFSPDGKKLAYTRDYNLYVMDIASGLESQLTEDGGGLIYNGYASWVYYEEILGRSGRYRSFWWAPDSKKLVYMRFDDSTVKNFSIYHSPGNYGFMETTRYPKSGEVNPLVKMGTVDITSAETTWFDFDEHEDAYIAWPFWTPDSEKVHVQWLNRDQNHLVIYECLVKDGSKTPIYEEKQDTWVEYFDDITYLKNGKGFILRSDKDGWSHLYLHDMQGKLTKRLTKGSWSVMSISGVDEKRGKVFFTARKEDTAGLSLYSVGLDGKDLTSLTKTKGMHLTSLSPGFDYFLSNSSDHKTPGQVRLYDASGKLMRNLHDSANPEFEDYQRAQLEFFTIPTTDGYQMPAWWMIPKNLDRSGQTKYAVIFRIYSGPGAPTVRNRYSNQWRDHYYANNGVITISVDHRASGHFGKKGIAYMHRKLGQWETHDLSKAVEWLREKPFIDPERIGITGHSYGGYMTLLALAKAPDHFTHGVAGAPVTDWALYDTVYTERYMDRPQDNPEGYKTGSVLEYAANIKGKLRLIHGDIDDNVHLQNTTQLVDILTRENIQFELMIYPGSRHGIRQRQHRADGENAFWFRHFLNRDFMAEKADVSASKAE